MSDDFYGKTSIETETVYISATPEAREWGKRWRVWRIYNHANVFKRWFEWVKYYAWWWKTLLKERRIPWVILEIMDMRVKVLNYPDIEIEK